MKEENKIKSLTWLIRHYQALADSTWETYPDLADDYLCYDHYLIHEKYYQDRLYAIFED